MFVLMALCVKVADHKEGRPLEQNHLVGIDSLAESLKVLLEGLDVGQEEGHDLRPSSVQSLVPDGCLETLTLESAVDDVEDVLSPRLEGLVSDVFSQQVHLVNQTEYLCVR